MLWFKKKPRDEEPKEADNVKEILESDETEKELDPLSLIDEDDIAEVNQAADYEEQESELDGGDEESELDEEEETDGETEEKPEEIMELTVKLRSLDDLAEVMNARRAGGMQFMRKETLEAFEIREAHIRLARVWGSVSMARECSDAEYGSIMLAMEVIKAPDSVYVIPTLTDAEKKKLIADFCEQKYGTEGKRYAKNPEKFAKFIKENGDASDWKAFAKESMYDLASEFCEKNGIEFSETEEESDD